MLGKASFPRRHGHPIPTTLPTTFAVPPTLHTSSSDALAAMAAAAALAAGRTAAASFASAVAAAALAATTHTASLLPTQRAL